MKMIISDIHLAGEPVKSVEEVSAYINGRLADANIKATIKKVGNTLEFVSNTEKKMFFVEPKNYIPLKEGDSRIKELGRNYLASPRLSKRQFKHLCDTFSKYLDMIAINCTIALYEHPEDMKSFIVIRDQDNNNFVNKWPPQGIFPVEKM